MDDNNIVRSPADVDPLEEMLNRLCRVRPTKTIQTKRNGSSGKPKSRLPEGSILVGYSINHRGGQRGKLRATRFWWLTRHDRDLDPDGIYKDFSPCEAVIPSSIQVGRGSLSYSIIEERKPSRKMDSPRNEMAVA